MAWGPYSYSYSYLVPQHELYGLADRHVPSFNQIETCIGGWEGEMKLYDGLVKYGLTTLLVE